MVKKRLKRVFISLLFILFILSTALADSIIFSTEINGVSSGLNSFGLGLFPLGSSFGYEYDFPSLFSPFESVLYLGAEFSFSETEIDSGFDYKTGAPLWNKRSSDGFYLGGSYFKPTSRIYTYLEECFGLDPFDKDEDPLLRLRLGLSTRYTLALESLSIGNGYPNYFTFLSPNGSYISPYGPEFSSPAFPWLSGNRRAWNNYIYLEAYWYLRRLVSLNAYDGLYAIASCQYGPYWLGNRMDNGTILSDFFRTELYADEEITLFAVKQDNGWNWVNMVVGHTDTAVQFFGQTVPEYWVPKDRLSGSVKDTFFIRLNGPQFMAEDNYAYATLTLENTVLYGRVVNTLDIQADGLAWYSTLSAYFHLRLFGFIRFDYSVWYDMFRGLSDNMPRFGQSASVNFYVSV